MTRALVMVAVSLLATSACGVAAQSNHPGPLAPSDFARGVEITPPAGPFFRVDLPAIVFAGTAWPDLRDLAVFNRAGEPVPFAKVTPARADGALKLVPLRPFRLESMSPDGVPRIELDARSQGVELRVAPGKAPEAGVEYLLAVSVPELDTPIHRLLLEWQERDANWRQTVNVQVSSNLDSWRTVAIGRPLMDLKTGDGSRLQHSEISVEPQTPQSARYWRLQFGPGDAPILTNVDGETRAAASALPGVSLPIKGPEARDGAAEYELGAPQPLARIRITPADANSVLPLIVEVREERAGNWISIARTVAYRLNAAGVEQFSDPVGLEGRLVSAIRLRPLGTAWGTSMPALDVERDPLTIVVNARGAGPFLLAWGCKAATDNSVPFGQLVPNLTSDRLVEIPQANIYAAVRELGGDSRLTDPAKPQWQTTLVWVVLVGGALALALLALRVWREARLSQDQT